MTTIRDQSPDDTPPNLKFFVMEELKTIIKQLKAVHILEYHNKNWLGNTNERNRMKRDYLNQMQYIIEKMEEPKDELNYYE